MTETFIRDCELWATTFNVALGPGDTIITDEGILGYRLNFANGQSIKALSSKPKNIRSKQARLVIDEAAFCDNFPAILKAGYAMLMWGGSIAVLSTHNGADSDYNALIRAIAEEDPAYSAWSHHKTTIDDAIAQGLYRRICHVKGVGWSPEGERNWLAETIRNHGITADEELRCRPYTALAGKVFDVSKLRHLPFEQIPESGLTVRFWDLASTERDIKKTKSKSEPCYTAGVKVRLHQGHFYVVDVIAVQFSAGDVDALIKATASADGHNCLVRWELEGGSAGKRDAHHLRLMLAGYDANAVRPQGDKVTRARPAASQVLIGNVSIAIAPWNKQYLDWLHGFPDAKYLDTTDATSGAFSVLLALQAAAKAAPHSGTSISRW
jgi:predicted phage terminase large subunit-like protein